MKISIIGTTMPNMAASMEDLTKLSGHAAGVCYMPDTFGALMCEPKEKTMRRANGTKASGHHSVFDHAFINLSLENIPKGLAMVLNNEQFYNTSEKSARYTKMVLKEGEQKLFDKWLDTYKNLIRDEYQAKYPNIFTEKKIEKLAQENARYLISVFTPTTMVYTVSLRQLNYLCAMMQHEIDNPSNDFYKALVPAMSDFVTSIQNGLKTEVWEQKLSQDDDPVHRRILFDYIKDGNVNRVYYDKDLAEGVNAKNAHLSLIKRSIAPETYFGDVFCTSYKGSLAQLAQAQRHRTISYDMTLLDTPEFYVPKIIRMSDELTREWKNDCESQASVFPQGLLVNINEYGSLDKFILKMKERKCTFAQLEIDNQTTDTLNRYVAELKRKGHPQAEMLEKYTHGSRCTFPDYKCSSPCGFKEGVTGERKI